MEVPFSPGADLGFEAEVGTEIENHNIILISKVPTPIVVKEEKKIKILSKPPFKK